MFVCSNESQHNSLKSTLNFTFRFSALVKLLVRKVCWRSPQTVSEKLTAYTGWCRGYSTPSIPRTSPLSTTNMCILPGRWRSLLSISIGKSSVLLKVYTISKSWLVYKSVSPISKIYKNCSQIQKCKSIW